MTTGRVLNLPPGPPQAVLGRSLIGPEKAILEALGCYLEAQTFYVRASGAAPVRPFVLESVATDWPDASGELRYPAGVLSEVTPSSSRSARFVPTPMDETLDRFCPGTVLWKLGETEVLLALDVWTTNDPEREAIRARLPALFAPGEESVVLLEAAAEYFGLTVRAELEDVTDRDVAGAVYAHERRLRAQIRASVDSVELRRATVLSPAVRLRVDSTED